MSYSVVNIGNIADINIEEHIDDNYLKDSVHTHIEWDDIFDENLKFHPLDIKVDASVWIDSPVDDDVEVTLDVELSDDDLSKILGDHLDSLERQIQRLKEINLGLRKDAYKGFDSNYHLERWTILASNSDSEVVFDGMMEMAKETMNV